MYKLLILEFNTCKRIYEYSSLSELYNELDDFLYLLNKGYCLKIRKD